MKTFSGNKKKFVFISIILLLIILGGAYYAFKSGKFEKTAVSPLVEKETGLEPDIPLDLSSSEIPIDLNADGEKEYVVLEMPESDLDNYLKSIKAYNQSVEEIASLPSNMVIMVPMTDSAKIHRLDENSTAEVFSLEFIAGPHQSETMFFGLNKDRILPICFMEIPEGPYDCLFYSGNVGYLPVKDLDGDGYVELLEVTDEYPGEGELSDEEESAIDKVFEEEGVTEFTEGAGKIALREKGGRGKSVVWAIFSYNGQYFVPQIGDGYEKYYSLIGDLIKNKMRKSELSDDSLEYTEYVRSFWGKKE